MTGKQESRDKPEEPEDESGAVGSSAGLGADLARHAAEIPERAAMMEKLFSAGPSNVLEHVRWNLVMDCIQGEKTWMVYPEPPAQGIIFEQSRFAHLAKAVNAGQ